MRAKYLEIASICVVEKTYVTIACAIILKGDDQSEPTYTNIFCFYAELFDLLDLTNKPLSDQIGIEINAQTILQDKEIVQIDIEDYIGTTLDIPYYIEVVLRPASDGGYAFKCYNLSEYY
ncbi:MAG: hypothetical protein COB85_09265 [Bacteroidetes bacterium]|nr:MAG: hypothetical protein COB85_09265 [Bacteroidota bacterium]